MGKHILFVSTHYSPDFHYGGVVESSTNLYQALKISDNSKYSLVTVSKTPKNVKAKLKGDEHCYQSFFFHRFGFSFELLYKLWFQIKVNDIIFINGTVTFPTVVAQIYSLLQKKCFIVSTRGTFGEANLRQKKWKKLFYYNLGFSNYVYYFLMYFEKYIMDNLKFVKQ